MSANARGQSQTWAASQDASGTFGDKMAPTTSRRSQTGPSATSETERPDEKLQKHRRIPSRALRSKGFTSGGSHVQHAKETVQSAIELMPPISFDHLLRRDKKSPAPSRRGSNSGHTPTHSHLTSDLTASWQDQRREAAKQRVVRPRDLASLCKENAQRQRDLRKSLMGVESIAMKSTRQLDDTYYLILEKASILRSTVASLQRLADESKHLQVDFEKSSQKLAHDTTQSLEGFAGLDTQANTIDELVGKLQDSKDRTQALNGRLDAARGRMEAFEQREVEHEKALRKRWWTCWAVVIAIAVMIVAFTIAKHRSAVGGTVYTVAKVLDGLGEEVKAPLVKLLSSGEKEEDPYLKELFDDL